MDFMIYLHLAHLQSETNGAAVFLFFPSFYISSGFKKEGSLPSPWQAAAPGLCGRTLSRVNSPHLESYEHLVYRSLLYGQANNHPQLAEGFQFNFHSSG